MVLAAAAASAPRKRQRRAGSSVSSVPPIGAIARDNTLFRQPVVVNMLDAVHGADGGDCTAAVETSSRMPDFNTSMLAHAGELPPPVGQSQITRAAKIASANAPTW
jgi:hypothetical protein